MHGRILKRDLRFWKRCCQRVKSLDITLCRFVNMYSSPDYLNYPENGDSELSEMCVYIDCI